jgi:hypothetical protein
VAWTAAGTVAWTAAGIVAGTAARTAAGTVAWTAAGIVAGTAAKAEVVGRKVGKSVDEDGWVLWRLKLSSGWSWSYKVRNKIVS